MAEGTQNWDSVMRNFFRQAASSVYFRIEDEDPNLASMSQVRYQALAERDRGDPQHKYNWLVSLLGARLRMTRAEVEANIVRLAES